MTLKKLLLSGIILSSLLAQTHTASANGQTSGLDLKLEDQTLMITHLDSLPQEGKITYAIWSEDRGKDDLVIYDIQNANTRIPLRQHRDFGNYQLEVYHTLNGTKTLIASKSFHRPDTTSKPHIISSTTTVTTSSTMSLSPTTTSTTVTIPSTEKASTQTTQATPQPISSQTTSHSTSTNPTTISKPKTSLPPAPVSQPITPRISTSFSKPNTLVVTATGIEGNPHEVLLPTWTEHKGQDDIQWYKMSPTSSGSYSIEIPLKNHNNEQGTYNLHLYKRNKVGEALIIQTGTTVTRPTPVISTPTPTKPTLPQKARFQVTNLNTSAGTYTLTVQPERSIRSLEVAVWSTKNQSNIKWYKLSPNASNSYNLAVSINRHQNLAGLYNNHIYINYSDGSRVGYVAPQADFSQFTPVPKPAPAPSPTPAPVTIPSASSNYLRTGFYELSYTTTQAGPYVFAVWSDKNGQDDLAWYETNATGQGSYKHQLDLSRHKDSGLYHFHIYKRSGTTLTGVSAHSFTVHKDHLAKPVSTPVPQPVTPPTPTTPSIPTSYVATHYPVGQCTWGAKQVAPWVGEWWGHAKSWADTARNLGYTVGTSPQVGSVAVWPTDGGGYGHVAVVTHVENANRIQVLESNYAGKQYISNFRGWFNPGQVWSFSSNSYIPAPVLYIYPKK